MRLTFDPWMWMVGFGFIWDVPMPSQEYLCDHYESALIVQVGPVKLSWWFRKLSFKKV